ncbi:MAG TPA: protein-glutamate O-methyltransferase CheR [Chloroflexota bacterium]|nr:protein-glutamate O-methyltransferase CheR [Chloroflexota bacterium]
MIAQLDLSLSAAQPIGDAPAVALQSIDAAFAAFVEERFGIRLSDQQRSRLDALIDDLLRRSTCHDAPSLLAALRSGGAENLVELAGQVVIGETHFFRVRPQMEALRHVVLPDLIAKRRASRCLRVWSAGCSTGEEPYTLAILLREQLPAAEEWQIEVVGSDLNPRFLRAAREARYGEWSFRDTSEEIRERYFERDDRRWRLREPLRRMVRFVELNLTDRQLPSVWAPGTELDLIVCRNVTIYFGSETTRQLHEFFTRSLAPDGWFIAGPSDQAPNVPGLQPVCTPGAIVWRRADDRPAHVATRRTPAAQQTLARSGRVFEQRPAVVGRPTQTQIPTAATPTAAPAPPRRSAGWRCRSARPRPRCAPARHSPLPADA